jgi:protein TonB
VEGGVEGGIDGGIDGGVRPPPSPLPSPAAPVRIGGNIQAPALIARVGPVYPEMVVFAHVRGIVLLEATVGADGRVEEVHVLRSVKLLDRAAIHAVKQWRYSPLVLNGVRTPFVLTVTLSFSLKE